MLRNTTIKKWKPIIDGYDHSRETIKQYCLRIGIETKKYYHYRKLLNEIDMDHYVEEIELLPVEIIDHPEMRNTNIRINGIPITYVSDSINDQELSRILRLCRDL